MLSVQIRDSQGLAPRDFLAGRVKAMEELGGPITVISGPTSSKIGGEPAWVVETSQQAQGRELGQKFYVTGHDGKLSIYLLSFHEELEQDAEEALEGIRFD